VNNTPTDYFALLGLPARFDLDQAELESSYRKQQALWHPDRFVSASDNERLTAVRQTSMFNDAFDTLRSPLKRIQHLLELQGVDTSLHAQHELDGKFLLQQMEWREILQECESAADEQGIENLLCEVRTVLDSEQQVCVASLENGDLSQAKLMFHRLQYLYKLTAEIRALEDRLLDY
jgi:molecular chaperone HscB